MADIFQILEDVPMNKDQNIVFIIEGLSVPLSQLAVGDLGEDSSSNELMAVAPDGAVVRFNLSSSDERIIGNLNILMRIFLPAIEVVYKNIQLQFNTPSKALTYDVKERFDNHWPHLDELIKDNELFIDAFENNLFDILRLIIQKPNKETRYLIEAVSPECIIQGDRIQLRLLLIECI